MSQYSYTKKPDYVSDGKLDRSTAAATVYPSALGWVSGVAGKNNKVTTSITAASAGATTTVVQTAHGLVQGQSVLITGATPAGLNGHVQVASVTDANTFVYATIGTVTNGAASVQGTVFKAVEVVVACSDLLNAATDISAVPTFTAAVTCPDGTLTAMVAGKTLRCILTASEPVEVRGGAQIQFTVTGAASVRQAIYNQTLSTTTSLVFDYTIPTPSTADVSSAGQVVFAAATNGGQIADILPKSRTAKVTVTFTAPATSTAAIV